MSTPPSDAQPRVAGWESCVCYTPVCKRNLLYVRHCDEQPDLWRVALSPNEGGWLVAAAGPLCPFCGATLLIPTQLGAGVALLYGLS